MGKSIQSLFRRLKVGVADATAAMLRTTTRPWGARAYQDVVNALWERQATYSSHDVKLCVPTPVTPDLAERPLVERIFAAYRQAKCEMAKQDAIFHPAGGWKNVLDSAYTYLVEGLENNDLDRFHYFLANFGAWDKATGIEQSSLFSNLQSSSGKKEHYEQRHIAPLIHWWETLESNGRSLEELTIPRFGNMGGAWVNGQLISPNSIFSDLYARLIAGLLGRETPVIGELGGGFGRLCYFLKRQFPQMTYVAFDLPECLSCASYFLMMSFPQQRFLLYGEADLTSECLSEYDFVLLPSYEITRFADRAADLFINENSLGMVPPDACRLFVKEICRSTRFFWHRNHEVFRNRFEDGTTSLVNREYPVDGDRFRLVVRHCDIARIIGHDRMAINNDMYWYFFAEQ